MIDYDPHQQGDTVDPPPKSRRVSKITGRATSLWPETEIQISIIVKYHALCDWDRELRLNTDLFAIAPNDGKLPQHVRALSQRMGKIAGPHDLQMLDFRRNTFTYWWFEVKQPGKKYTPEQARFAERLKRSPVKCVIVYSADDFERVIRGA